MKAVSKTLFGANPAYACPLYVAARSGMWPDQRMARKNCEDMWRTFEPYADEHFLSEFPLQFHQRWFEMRLTVFLLRAGHNVACPKPGPDIRIELDGQVVWIEAVCATAGQEGKPDSVPRPVHGQVSKTPMNAYALRVTNALHTKAKAFEGYIAQGIVRDGDLAVIAINVHEVGLGPYLRDVMKLALYGQGNLVIRFDRFTKEFVDTRHENVNSISKISNRALVGTQPFLDSSMPHVSAAWGFMGCAANSCSDIATDCIQAPNLAGIHRWREGTILLGREWKFEDTQNEWRGTLR